MPIPAYMFIDGIPGSVTVAGREGSVEVLALDHSVDVPIDVKDATATGTRRHNSLVITKVIDQASPLLQECVCRSKTIPKAEIKFYKIDDSGTEIHYYSITIEKLRAVVGKTELPNVAYPENALVDVREKWAFRYEKITWLYVDGSFEFSDEWKLPRV
ncbi:MAG: type VI secretion system tube protein Hcp [Deltaproteobacteria bacterium]|nr:type VI secretion system tube protein Hcp [Deltaproteobacteria bacterium]MBN2670660.1 type VI secretion system tube protein Hcp [Deltaproteobacteria bacterium]